MACLSGAGWLKFSNKKLCTLLYTVGIMYVILLMYVYIKSVITLVFNYGKLVQQSQDFEKQCCWSMWNTQSGFVLWFSSKVLVCYFDLDLLVELESSKQRHKFQNRTKTFRWLYVKTLLIGQTSISDPLLISFSQKTIILCSVFR